MKGLPLLPRRTSLVVLQRKRNIRTLLFPLSDIVFSSILHSRSSVVKDSQMQNQDICSEALITLGGFPKVVTMNMNEQPQ